VEKKDDPEDAPVILIGAPKDLPEAVAKRVAVTVG
jgi:hypothetical protein